MDGKRKIHKNVEIDTRLHTYTILIYPKYTFSRLYSNDIFDAIVGVVMLACQTAAPLFICYLPQFLCFSRHPSLLVTPLYACYHRTSEPTWSMFSQQGNALRFLRDGIMQTKSKTIAKIKVKIKNCRGGLYVSFCSFSTLLNNGDTKGLHLSIKERQSRF